MLRSPPPSLWHTCIHSPNILVCHPIRWPPTTSLNYPIYVLRASSTMHMALTCTTKYIWYPNMLLWCTCTTHTCDLSTCWYGFQHHAYCPCIYANMFCGLLCVSIYIPNASLHLYMTSNPVHMASKHIKPHTYDILICCYDVQPIHVTSQHVAMTSTIIHIVCWHVLWPSSQCQCPSNMFAWHSTHQYGLQTCCYGFYHHA